MEKQQADKQRVAELAELEYVKAIRGRIIAEAHLQECIKAERETGLIAASARAMFLEEKVGERR